MCFYLTTRFTKWLNTLTCHDVLINPLKFLAKLAISLPITLLLVVWALGLSLYKWPRASHLSMRDSYHHFRGVLKEGAQSYEDEEQGRQGRRQIDVDDPCGLDRCGKQVRRVFVPPFAKEASRFGKRRKQTTTDARDPRTPARGEACSHLRKRVGHH